MLKWYRRSLIVPAVGCLIAIYGGLSGTFASFLSNTTNAGNGFAAASLYAPTGLTATGSPRSVSLGWQAGRNGSGYRIMSAPAPVSTSPGCSGASYVQLTSVSGLGHTDPRFAPQGTWHCYMVETMYGSWTSVQNNPSISVQLGFVVTDVQLLNGGTAGQLDQGDKITVTFNHPVASASGPLASNSVCTLSGAILIGSATASGGCNSDESVSLGWLYGGSADRSARFAISAATWANNQTTLTVALGARTNGNRNPSVPGPWTLIPTSDAAKLLSASGSHHVCDTNSGGGNCYRSASSTF